MSSESALILKNWQYMKCRPDSIVLSKSCEYKVHRIVLLCLSPYFQTVFHYRSKSSDGYYRLDMKDVSDHIMVAIINFSYSGQIDITEVNAEELVITADKYNIISVMNRCQQFLWQTLNVDNCISIYLLSHYYNCHQLKTRIKKLIFESKEWTQTKLDSTTDQVLNIGTVLNEWQKQNKY